PPEVDVVVAVPVGIVDIGRLAWLVAEQVALRQRWALVREFALVTEHDHVTVETLLTQCFCGFRAGEAAADDHVRGLVRLHCHVPNLSPRDHLGDGIDAAVEIVALDHQWRRDPQRVAVGLLTQDSTLGQCLGPVPTGHRSLLDRAAPPQAAPAYPAAAVPPQSAAPLARM